MTFENQIETKVEKALNIIAYAILLNKNVSKKDIDLQKKLDYEKTSIRLKFMNEFLIEDVYDANVINSLFLNWLQKRETLELLLNNSNQFKNKRIICLCNSRAVTALHTSSKYLYEIPNTLLNSYIKEGYEQIDFFQLIDKTHQKINEKANKQELSDTKNYYSIIDCNSIEEELLQDEYGILLEKLNDNRLKHSRKKQYVYNYEFEDDSKIPDGHYLTEYNCTITI